MLLRSAVSALWSVSCTATPWRGPRSKTRFHHQSLIQTWPYSSSLLQATNNCFPPLSSSCVGRLGPPGQWLVLLESIIHLESDCLEILLQNIGNLPANDATNELAHAIAAAVKAQGAQDAAVLMLVQPGEKNSYDQQVDDPSWQWSLSVFGQ